MRNLVYVFLGIGVGFFAHKYAIPPPPSLPASSSEYEHKYLDLKNKLEQLGEVDIEEYLALKTEKEKYLKANEIFEKILKIFLLDLGLRSSQSKIDALKTQAVVVAETPKTVTPRISDKPEFFPSRTPKPNTNLSGWTKTAMKASEISFDSEIKEFLDSVTVGEFDSQVRSAITISLQQFHMFSGRYEGEVTFDERTQPNWQVVMEMTGRREDNAIIGKTKISLSKNGKEFSNTSGDGNILDGNKSSFQAFPGVKNAILVNAYGDDGYFQLFYFARLNQFAGVVYTKKKGETLKRVGIVSLQKIS